MEANTKFSVVIPLYNKEDYILKALGSVYSQLNPASEIIVIDDGSTDNGPELVKTHYPEVLIETIDNSGPGGARNYGIARACNEWVALLDADDIWLPNHLCELSKLIVKNEDVGFVSS